MSDSDLLGLVDGGLAQYVLLIRAPKTHHRELLRSTEPKIYTSIPGGSISGRVEFTPFLISARRLPQFQASGWHEDFAGLTFDIEAGAVLAEDKETVYWIDTADEAPLGSIFELVSADVPDGRWQCQLDGERVSIAMSTADSQRYRVARERANSTPDGQYLMNGLYLPALIHVLSIADRDQDTYSDRRWYASLDQRLHALGCAPLGSGQPDRVVDAQKVLESPFGKMPIIALAEGDV